MRVLAPAALGLLLTGALVGCSITDPGQPTATDGGQTTTTTTARAPATSTTPDSGAPRVTNPLETRKFQEDPCLSLTAAQADELGVRHPGKPEKAADGKGCLWSNDVGGQVHLLWSNTLGLDSAYRLHSQGGYDLFEEVPDVAGLPAIVANVLDRREDGNCTVMVGTSDHTLLTLGLSQSRSKIGTADPCAVAADVAGRIVTTIKGG